MDSIPTPEDEYQRGYEAGRAAMAHEASRVFMEIMNPFQHRRYQERTGGAVRVLRAVENLDQ